MGNCASNYEAQISKQYRLILQQKVVFSEVIWPYKAIGNTSWVCDPKLLSYALEQAERLTRHARAKNFAWNPLYHQTRTQVPTNISTEM